MEPRGMHLGTRRAITGLVTLAGVAIGLLFATQAATPATRSAGEVVRPYDPLP